MAFNALKFTSVSGQAIAGNAAERWTYETQDNKAAVSALNYFLPVSTLVHEGNIISVKHMSTPVAGSSVSTVVDEVDYVVAYIGGKDNVVINGIRYSGNKILAYPLQKGEQCLIKYIDNATTFNNQDSSFTFPVGLNRIAIVSSGTLGNNFIATVKESSNAGQQLLTLQLNAAGSQEGSIVESPALPGSIINVNTTFNIAGNTPANSAIPLRILLVGNTDSYAFHTERYYTAYFADLNAARSQSFVVPFAGTVTKVVGSVNGDPGAAGGTFTTTINGVAVTNGVATVPNGSAQYANNIAIPTAQNAVPGGGTITVTTGATNAVAGWCTIVVQE